MIDTGRLKRATWPEVQPVAPGRFLVRGGRAVHMVDIDRGWVRCDCADYSLRGDACKHCLVVRLHSGDPLAVKTLRQLVPAPGRSVRVA